MKESEMKELLRLAGDMADVAGAITGEGLNGRYEPCRASEISDLIVTLKEAVRAYNNKILELSSYKECEQ